MSWEVWIAFVVASAVLLAIPGPTVMLVVSYALGRGRGTAWSTVPGVALGDLTAMTVSLAGAGAVLSASAGAFTVLKLAGAAYLFWLAVKLWRAAPALPGGDAYAPAVPHPRSGETGRAAMFANAFIVTALNPKGIVFFVAFVPQFVDPGQPVLAQFAVLEATFVTLAAVNVALWAVLAGEMRARFRNPATLRRMNRTGAGFLAGAGLFTAFAKAN